MDDNYDLDQDAKIHVPIIDNFFCIILKFAVQYRGNISNNKHQQTNMFPLSERRVIFVCNNEHEALYQNTQNHVFIIKNSFLNIFSTKALNPACELSIISLMSSSEWVEKQTHKKITKDRVGCGNLTAMVMITKNQLHLQNNWGSVHNFFFVKII